MPGALSAAPGPGGDVIGPSVAWRGRGPFLAGAVGPGLKQGPGTFWIPAKGQRTRRKVGRKEAKGCAAEAADAEKAGNAGKPRASAAGMLAFIVPGVAKAVHGKSGTCSGAL